MPCQTYELMKKKSEVEDAVWRPYEGVESVGEDEVLKEVVERSGRGSGG